MIHVTEEARDHIRRLLATAGPPEAGIRITARAEGDGGDLACEVEVAGRPKRGDAVLETGGVRLFFDARAADALDDAELVVEDGELALALPEAGGCGAT